MVRSALYWGLAQNAFKDLLAISHVTSSATPVRMKATATEQLQWVTMDLYARCKGPQTVRKEPEFSTHWKQATLQGSEWKYLKQSSIVLERLPCGTSDFHSFDIHGIHSINLNYFKVDLRVFSKVILECTYISILMVVCARSTVWMLYRWLKTAVLLCIIKLLTKN